MKIVLSSHYQQYTGGRAEVEADGKTLRAAMKDLDRQFPGLRFRIFDEQENVRRHVNMTAGGKRVKTLGDKVPAKETLYILGALSGG